jgi:hypothetical protein
VLVVLLSLLSNPATVIQGHGRLHDIYASVEHAATLKGWGGVDLLIIGGDFQVSTGLLWPSLSVLNDYT